MARKPQWQATLSSEVSISTLPMVWQFWQNTKHNPCIKSPLWCSYHCRKRFVNLKSNGLKMSFIVSSCVIVFDMSWCHPESRVATTQHSEAACKIGQIHILIIFQNLLLLLIHAGEPSILIKALNKSLHWNSWKPIFCQNLGWHDSNFCLACGLDPRRLPKWPQLDNEIQTGWSNVGDPQATCSQPVTRNPSYWKSWASHVGYVISCCNSCSHGWATHLILLPTKAVVVASLTECRTTIT